MCAEALAYWRLATQYLDLAEAASAELVDSGNPSVVVADDPPSDAQYREASRWSDHRIGVAVLFNFYHGIELILKGFIALNGDAPCLRHSLTQLLADFERRHPDTEVGVLISDYTSRLDTQSPLGRFFAENHTKVDHWYQALRYPESRQGQPFDHLVLKYGSSDCIRFWEALRRAVRDIRVASLERSLEGA